MPFKVVPAGYGVWQGMKQRCNNPNFKQYKDYGGRGVAVCPQWSNNFQQFISDMGPPPEGCTLDRIDNNGNYTPENCRWATRKQQQRNQTVTRIVTIDGVNHVAADLAESLGLKTDTIINRVNRGLTKEQILKKERTMDPEHMRKAQEGSRKAMNKRCKSGHERTPENTHTTPQGWNNCKICNRERVKRQRERKLAAS